MIKNIGKSILLLVSLLCVNLSVQAQDNNIIDQIIWVVGGEAILKSDVEEARLAMLSQGEHMDGDPYCFIPEQLAIRKLFMDQAAIDSIEVSNADLNREVAQREKYDIGRYGSREKLEEYSDMTIHQYREMLFEQARTEHMLGSVRNKLTANVKLTPSEVRKYYSQLPQDSLPYIPTSVEVQILTNNPIIPLTEIDVIKGRLRDFTNRVVSGDTDFATLAILYSEDGSAVNGGELGFMGRGMLDPAFASTAFSLSDPAKVSNIVESEYGYHIIQLIERRGDRGNFRHILLKPQVPQAEFEISKTKLADLRDSISANVFSFEEAVFHASYDKDTRQSEGLMVNTQRVGSDGYAISTSRFYLEELPPEVGKSVVDLKVGEISKPFLMKDKNGKDIVAIAKLKSKVEGHVANVSDDYETLRQIVEANKKEEIIDKWIKKKIKETYVQIDKQWQNCEFKYDGWLKED